jgi:hypothetical protein
MGCTSSRADAGRSNIKQQEPMSMKQSYRRLPHSHIISNEATTPIYLQRNIHRSYSTPIIPSQYSTPSPPSRSNSSSLMHITPGGRVGLYRYGSVDIIQRKGYSIGQPSVISSIPHNPNIRKCTLRHSRSYPM